MKHIPVTLGIKKMTISTNIAQHTCQVERELPNIYNEFTNIFQQKDTDGLPPSWPFDHTIQLEDLFTPQQAKSYLLNPVTQEVCKAFLDEHLKNRQIHPSQSLQAFLFFFVPKKKWNPQILPGLLLPQLPYGQECLPTSPHLWPHWQIKTQYPLH